MPSEARTQKAAILVKAHLSKTTLKAGKISFRDYRLIFLSVNLSPFTSG